MQVQVGSTRPANIVTDILVVGFHGKPGRRSPAWQQVASAWGRGLEGRLKELGWTAAPGEVALIPCGDGFRARMLAVCSLGERGEGGPDALRKLARSVGGIVRRSKLGRVAFFLDAALDERIELDRMSAQALGEGLVLGGYGFDKLKSAGTDSPMTEAQEVFVWFGGRKERPMITAAIERGAIIARAANEARDLVNEPANRINPTTLTDYARALAASKGLEITVLDAQQCADLGMHSFLAVGRGAAVPSSFVHLAHKPLGATRKVALVGKAVTFDSGGLCLKPAASQATMKIDMAGSAAVLGTMAAVAELNLPIEVHGIFAACENMTGADAYHTGDVITASNGKTIEVLNTDAEGRLTLADALHYACGLKPDSVVDLATLTGACMVALGPLYAGLMGTGRGLVRELKGASDRSGEPVWELPLPPQYKEMLKSKVADIANVGGRFGGAITAGLFLSEFVSEDVQWAHIDLAGPVYMDKPMDGNPAGATGFGVRLLTEWLSFS